MAKLFYDFEFTGLQKNTTPISLGITASNGKQFYAEFTDYSKSMINKWLSDNVISNLRFSSVDEPFRESIGDVTMVKGKKEYVKKHLRMWLSQFNTVEFWGDCSWYDSVLMNSVLGGAFSLPKNVNYIYFDIGTVFKVYGVDPDVSREAFIDKPINGIKHNALYDSEVIQACYDKLYRNRDRYLSML